MHQTAALLISLQCNTARPLNQLQLLHLDIIFLFQPDTHLLHIKVSVAVAII